MGRASCFPKATARAAYKPEQNTAARKNPPKGLCSARKRETRLNPTPFPSASFSRSADSARTRALDGACAKLHRARSRARTWRSLSPTAAAQLSLAGSESGARSLTSPALGTQTASPYQPRVPAFRIPPAWRRSMTRVRHPFVLCLGAQALSYTSPDLSQTFCALPRKGRRVCPWTPSSSLHSTGPRSS